MIKQGFDFIMFTQKDWLDLAKGRLHIRSDYALAKRWDVSASEVSQYRRDRLRLPLAVILDIAEVMRCDPMEIITGLEYRRCRERDRERIKSEHFRLMTKSNWYFTDSGNLSYKGGRWHR